MKRAFSGVLLTLLLAGMLYSAFKILPVIAQGTIYIRADGGIDPPTAPISTVDNVTYVLTGNITSDADGIVIERDNIMLNGEGYGLQGRAPSFSDSKGIDLSGRENVTITNINVDRFGWGVSCYGSSNVSVFRSSIAANNYYAVVIQSSIACKVSDNNVTNNYYGIYLDNSTCSTLSDNYIANNGIGVIFGESHSNIVTESILENDHIGVMLGGSCYNCFEGNVMIRCGDALSICASSSNNSIIRNSIALTTGYGIGFFDSTENTVVCNNIADNEVGIQADCSNNTLFHNNVVNNARQVYDYSWDYPEYPLSINTWDDGYPSGGNYWGDYNGTDTNGDGFGDTPYLIDLNNQDNYPLVSPYEYWYNPIPADVNRDMRVDIRDIACVCLRFLTTPASPNWNPVCDMNGDGVVNMSDIAMACSDFGKHV